MSKYNRVVDKGCPLMFDETADADSECPHGYDWLCDDCPVVIEREKGAVDEQ